MPAADFYNADKTFKSPEEIRRMLAYLGVRPDQQVHAHCGGGIAASVPFFAMKFMVDYPRVKLYKESQLEWLRDDRGLPFWTYDAPNQMRDKAWLNGWGSRMVRSFGVAKLSVVDVRPAASFNLGHVPFAINVPAEVFRRDLELRPRSWPKPSVAAGVDVAQEAVIVSTGGLNPDSALAFLMLERLGQKQSLRPRGFHGGLGIRGFPAGSQKKRPRRVPSPPAHIPGQSPAGHRHRGSAGQRRGCIPKSSSLREIASRQGTRLESHPRSLHGPRERGRKAQGRHGHLEHFREGRRSALRQHRPFSDDPGEAAANYFVLKLMGYPDVTVLAAAR